MENHEDIAIDNYSLDFVPETAYYTAFFNYRNWAWFRDLPKRLPLGFLTSNNVKFLYEGGKLMKLGLPWKDCAVHWPLVLRSDAGKALLKLPYPIKEITLSATIIPEKEEHENDSLGYRHHVLLESAMFQTRMELGKRLPSKMSGRNSFPRSVKKVSNGQYASWDDVDEIVILDTINAIFAEIDLITRYISIVREANPTPCGKSPLFGGEPIQDSIFSVAATDCTTAKLSGRESWIAMQLGQGKTTEQAVEAWSNLSDDERKKIDPRLWKVIKPNSFVKYRSRKQKNSPKK